MLGWFENGMRHISNRLRPLNMPADLAGMKIRVLPSDVQARTFALLGAEPVKCDLTEAIAWIKEGKLDAQENPLANTVTYGVHKFHHFHSLTSHFYISRPIFLHRTAFDPGLPISRTPCAARSGTPSSGSANRQSRKTAMPERRSKIRAARSANSPRTNTPPSPAPSSR